MRYTRIFLQNGLLATAEETMVWKGAVFFEKYAPFCKVPKPKIGQKVEPRIAKWGVFFEK